ncbi:GNAT family N-acetyltransferase [Vibrio pectenicida]|uniref:N-acetyltransferase n=1 Tax=Vibrio pectenicida TaxID=62763 RepID=A0A3R9F7I2_9VIBR|nr:GNAT family N-acetyltransferase [Vibrio pectenicida]NOH70511.1 GNAT family N-acetyltransferase [Vibrio pectenicida]RSD31623.1 N-acetyltransferase [Vibrio pectenicida]
MNIHFRTAKATDFDNVVELYVNNMDLRALTKATCKSEFHSLAILNLAQDFYKANMIMVAECKSEICGVIIATSAQTNQVAISFDPAPRLQKANMALKNTPQGQRILAERQDKLTSYHHKIQEDDGNSELLLICIDKKFRRQKIGSQLIEQYEAFLRQLGVNKYRLVSDNLCTYQYYDTNGYDCVKQEESAFNPDVTRFIYTKNV